MCLFGTNNFFERIKKEDYAALIAKTLYRYKYYKDSFKKSRFKKYFEKNNPGNNNKTSMRRLTDVDAGDHRIEVATTPTRAEWLSFYLRMGVQLYFFGGPSLNIHCGLIKSLFHVSQVSDSVYKLGDNLSQVVGETVWYIICWVSGLICLSQVILRAYKVSNRVLSIFQVSAGIFYLLI